MRLNSFAQDGSYSVDIDATWWRDMFVEPGGKNVPVITFEFTNQDVLEGDKMPDGATYIMTLEDAKELAAWLPVAIANLEKSI